MNTKFTSRAHPMPQKLWRFNWPKVAGVAALLIGFSSNLQAQSTNPPAPVTKQWDRTLGGNKSDQLQAMVRTSDGGYLLGGSSESDKTWDKSQASRGGTDYWIVKLDSNGKKLWDKTFGGSGNDDLKALVATPDGGYLLGGASTSGKSGDKSQASKGQEDYWVLKIDNLGNKLWDKTYGSNAADTFTSLITTPDGGYLLGGYTPGGKSGDKTEASLDAQDRYTDQLGSGDYWVVKLNSAGEKEWDKTVGGKYREKLTSLVVTEGGYLLAGTTNSYDSNASPDAFDITINMKVFKISTTGQTIWEKGFSGEMAFLQYDEANTIATTDGNYLLGGSAFNDDFNVLSVVKITKAGQKIWAYENNGYAYRGSAMVNTPDGGYLLGGADGESEKHYLITKLNTNGQVVYTKSYNSIPFSGNFDYLKALLPTPDGGYLLGGYSQSNQTADKTENSRGDYDYWVIKIKEDQPPVVNPSGPVAKLWDRTLGGIYSTNQSEDNFGRSELKKVISTPDGGYLLGGYSDSFVGNDKSAPNKGGGDFWVVKLDATGKKLWDKTYGGLNYDALTSLTVAADGGYLLAGSSRSSIGGDKTGANRAVCSNGFCTQDYWVIKIDANGNKQWDKTFGGTQDDILYDVVATGDNGFLLGGTSDSGKEGDKSEANKGVVDELGFPTVDYWVVKINATGQKVWDKTFGGNKSDFFRTIVPLDNGFLLSGNSGSTISGDKSEANDGLWVVKIDAAGNKLNDKTYSFANGAAFEIFPTSDKGFLLGGESPTKGYYVVKVDAQGKPVWEKTYGGNRVQSITATPDGGYLLGGTSFEDIGANKSEASRGGNDYWIVKIDAQGNKLWDKTLGGNQEENFANLVIASDGGYVLGGTSFSDKSGDKSEARKGYDSDYWVVKIKEDQTTNTAWNMRYGGSGTEGFTTVIKTADGGYLSGGYTNSGVSGDKSQTSQGKNDYWIVKSDKNGKKLWDKRFGGSGDDYLYALLQTQDGGYLLGGSSLSNVSGDKTQASRGNRDYWIVKVSSTGVKQWDKRFGGSGVDEFRRLVQLNSGDYVLAGNSNSPAGGDKSQASRGGNDYWILKISSTGTKIWDKRFGGTLDENLEGLTATLDGGFLVGGSSLSGATGDKTQFSRGGNDYWLVRLDASGNKVWDKRFGGSGEDNLTALGSTGTSTGNFFIAGTSTSGQNGDKSQTSQGGQDFWMLKISSSGSKLFDKRFGGSSDDALRSIILTQDGGYLLGGTSASGVSGDKTQASQGGNDYWIVKTNASGSKQWDKRLGGSGYDEIRTVLQTPDNGYLLGGRSNSGATGDKTQPSQGGTDYWLVKIAPVTSPTVASREASLVAEPVSELATVKAYPNPFQDKLTVSFTLPETQAATLRVLDGQGREVATLFQGEAKANQKYEVEWQAGKQESGLYLLQLQTPTQKNTQKLLLTK